MDTTFRSASTSLTAAFLVCAFASPCVQAQTTPGQIPQPWTYEGSKELQRRSDQSDQQQRQQQQQQQQYPSTQGSSPSASPSGGARLPLNMCRTKPVRAAEPNPLIGQWRYVGPLMGRGDMMSEINSVAAAISCPAYAGGFDLRTKSMIFRGKEIPANYGRDGDVWWGCSEFGSSGFRVANPNRLHMVDPQCAFERTGGSPSAQSPAATGTGRPAQVAAAQTASTAASGLLVQNNVVYVCRDGRVVVSRCRSDEDQTKHVTSRVSASQDYCTVAYPDRPKRNGFTVQEAELRASVVRNLQSCKVE